MRKIILGLIIVTLASCAAVQPTPCPEKDGGIGGTGACAETDVL